MEQNVELEGMIAGRQELGSRGKLEDLPHHLSTNNLLFTPNWKSSNPK